MERMISPMSMGLLTTGMMMAMMVMAMFRMYMFMTVVSLTMMYVFWSRSIGWSRGSWIGLRHTTHPFMVLQRRQWENTTVF